MLRHKQKVLDIVEQAEPNLWVIGMFATVGYPLFYIVWKEILPQPYESLVLRLIEAVISLPWLFYPFLSRKFKDIFPIYFIFSVPFLLPFFFYFMMLKNGWSMTWVMSSMGGLLMLILLIYDWVLICLITAVGFGMAYGVVVYLDGNVSFIHFQPEYIPTYLFALIGGIIVSQRKQNAHLTKISLLKSLSGSIAHEMRNPLNSITNALASVHAKLPEKPDRENAFESYDISHSGLISIHHVIDESSNTLNRANKIIDSILTSMQGGEVSTQGFIRMNGPDAINAAVKSFPYTDPDDMKLIHIKNIQNFEFLGDRDLFYYVLFNLLKNALYYKKKQGFRIDITAETTPSVKNIRIRDTGPGIPKSKRERIFENFYTANKKEGNGLGLSFCRRVIDSFGGKIICDSKEGEWTEFTITLPKYDSKKVNEIKAKILSAKRILISDDQISNRLILSKYISEMNCQFDLAEDGQQALAMLSKNLYDLVLIDFEMPFFNGDEVVRSTRSAQDIDPSLALHYLQAPIIGITALPEAEATVRARKCGMNEVLAKPVRRADIHKIIERYFFSELSFTKNDQKEIIDGKRILLVDDNETSRKFMSMLLNNYGCRVGQAIHGREAINALEKEDYDLVLMDVEMPVMNGIEATKAIRSGEYFTRFSSFNTLPIIGLTGNTDAESSRDIMDAGMNYHLGKPVFKDELISAIAVMLKNNNHRNMIMNSQNSKEHEHNNSKFWSAIETEKILDLSTINSLKEIGGKELLESLFETFITDCNKLINELADAVVRQDIKQSDHILHTLKGSTGSIGANKMYVLTKYFNEFSHKGKWPENDSWMDILNNTYAETVHELQKLDLQ
ncbi:MAG: response regulator [Chlorobiales bacterium]|nr:response regulator [Chlorobiales bacterium]